MKQVNVYEAKTLEEIIIARDGVPLVRLTPISEPSRPQLLGDMRGQIKIYENFDAPLEEFAEY